MHGTNSVKLALVLLCCQQCVCWWFCNNVGLITTRLRLGHSDDWLEADGRDFLLVQTSRLSLEYTQPLVQRVLVFL